MAFPAKKLEHTCQVLGQVGVEVVELIVGRRTDVQLAGVDELSFQAAGNFRRP
jgi:hypothetical protein